MPLWELWSRNRSDFRSCQETPTKHHVNALLYALMRRQSKCEPYRDESFGALAPCGFCCSGFLPGLSSGGGDTCFDLSFIQNSLRWHSLTQNRRPWLIGRCCNFKAPKGNVREPGLESRTFPLRWKLATLTFSAFFGTEIWLSRLGNIIRILQAEY